MSIRKSAAKANCVWLRVASKMLSTRTIVNGWTANSPSENMICEFFVTYNTFAACFISKK